MRAFEFCFACTFVVVVVFCLLIGKKIEELRKCRKGFFVFFALFSQPDMYQT